MVKIIKGKNDLATTNPELVKEWDYKKNTISPNEVTAGSHKKAFWVCNTCGNRWEAEIKSRNSGRGCPICGRKKGSNSKATAKIGGSFAVLRPDLLSEWDYNANSDIDPYKINPGTKRKVYWKCKNGHTWMAAVNKRVTRNQGCPFCYRTTKTSFPEQAIFYYLEKLFKANNRDKVDGFEFDIFLPEERIAVEYDGYYWHQSDHSIDMEKRKNSYCNVNNIILFRIKETIDKNQTINISSNVITYRYDSEYTLLNDVITILLTKIGDCVGKTISITPDVYIDRSLILSNYEQAEYDSSLMQYPELVAEWDYKKNVGLKPQNVSPGSEIKVYWRCSKGHSYYSRVSHRVNGVGCPYCSGKRVIPGETDLATAFPELALEWNYEKNGDLLPSQVMPSASKKVWWECRFGHEWQATINSRTSGKGCPFCSGRSHPKIRCVETGKEYDTFVAVKKELGLDQSKVSMVVKGKRESIGGLHFEYVDE